MPVYSLQFPLYLYDSGIPDSPSLITSYKPLLFWMNSDFVYDSLTSELYISLNSARNCAPSIAPRHGVKTLQPWAYCRQAVINSRLTTTSKIY